MIFDACASHISRHWHHLLHADAAYKYAALRLYYDDIDTIATAAMIIRSEDDNAAGRRSAAQPLVRNIATAAAAAAAYTQREYSPVAPPALGFGARRRCCWQ